MNRLRRIAITGFATMVAATGLPPGTLHGQTTPTRSGFWFGLGFGAANARVSCDICKNDRGVAPTLLLKAGGTISQRVLIGGEVNGWLKSEDDISERMGTASVLIYWYATSSSTLHVKGGLSLIGYRLSAAQDPDGSEPDPPLTSTAFGFEIGLGYEFRVSTRLSVAPYFNAVLGSLSDDLTVDGENIVDNVSLTLLALGLGLTWH